jgi:hypothetical protein
MKMPLILFVSLILLIPSASALQLEDNQYFTMPPDEIECIDIVLPDDMGVFGMGKVEYELTSTAEREWADLTEEHIVRTDENNTVIFPMCFYSFGRQEGDCSEPYTITISAPSLQLEKRWSGGACVSEFRDVDIGGVNESPWDAVNRNTDLFDAAFGRPVIYSEPDGTVNYELLLESYASITLDLAVQPTVLAVTPRQETVTLSIADPQKAVAFSVNAPPQAGRYDVAIRASMRECDLGGFCVKLARGELVVTEEVPANSGFSVSLFPKNINTKSLFPVSYMFTIQNGDRARAFSTAIILPEGMLSTFTPETTELGPNGKKVIEFKLTPGDVSSFYEIKATATSEGNTKQAVSHMSTNEMLTDAVREANSISTDPSTEAQVNDGLDRWIDTYRKSGYGEDLDDYKNLKDTFDDAGQAGTNGGNGGYTNGAGTSDGGIDSMWLIGGIIIAIVVIIMVLIYSMKSKKSVLEKEI